MNKIYFLLAIGLYGLVFVSAHQQNDCTLEWFHMKAQQIYSANLDTRNSQSSQKLINTYLECEAKLSDAVKVASGRIPREAKEIVEQLTSDVIEALKVDGNFHNDLQDYDTEALENGLQKFVNQQISAFLAKQGEIRVIMKVSAIVGSACKKAYNELRQVIEIFDIFGDQGEITSKIDTYSREWLTRGRVCEMLLGSEDLVRTACKKAYINKQLAAHEGKSKLNKEWAILKAKVFARDNKGSKDIIKPVELLADLKRMSEIYMQLNPLSLMDEEDQWYAGKVEELIEFAVVNKDKCKQDTFVRFRQEKLTNDIYPKTVFPYLSYFGREQYAICKPIIESGLSRGISELTDKEREDFEELSYDVFGNNCTSYVSVPYGIIIKGSLKFLESRAKLDGNPSAKDIDLTFKQQLDGLCRTVVTKLQDAVETYEAIMSNKDLKHLIEPGTVDWTFKYRMCTTFETHRASIIRGIQNALKRLNGTPLSEIIKIT